MIEGLIHHWQSLLVTPRQTLCMKSSMNIVTENLVFEFPSVRCWFSWPFPLLFSFFSAASLSSVSFLFALMICFAISSMVVWSYCSWPLTWSSLVCRSPFRQISSCSSSSFWLSAKCLDRLRPSWVGQPCHIKSALFHILHIYICHALYRKLRNVRTI